MNYPATMQEAKEFVKNYYEQAVSKSEVITNILVVRLHK